MNVRMWEHAATQANLATLRERIKRIEADEADPDTRARRIAAVLAQAFEQAAKEDGDRIGAVFGPAIGEGIRHQLETDRPAMVAALVPMVGSLVAGAVAEAMDKVSSGINDRVDRLFSFRGLKLALGAKVSGDSLNDALLADMRRAAVERLYLFNRTTDRLAFTWPDRGDDDLSDHTAGEILDSVLGRTGEILSEGDHAVRSIAIGDRHLVIRAGATHTVVIEASGALSDDRRAALGDACFKVLDFLSNLTDDLPDADLDEDALSLFIARLMAQKPVARPAALAATASRRRFNPALCLAAVLGIAVISILGWRLYDGHRIQSRAAAIDEALRAEFLPGSLMLSVSPDRRAGTIAVAGAAFADADRAVLQARADDLARPYALSFDLVMGNPDAAAPRIGTIEQRLARIDTALTASGGVLASVDSRADQGVAALASLRDPVRLLTEFAESNAVFFDSDAVLRDPDRAARTFDRLAALMAAVPDRPLRIIGHSDALGPFASKIEVAMARASSVVAALEARGIPANRLVPLSRSGPEWSISAQEGTGSPNRRVEFALGFPGETR